MYSMVQLRLTLSQVYFRILMFTGGFNLNNMEQRVLHGYLVTHMYMVVLYLLECTKVQYVQSTILAYGQELKFPYIALAVFWQMIQKELLNSVLWLMRIRIQQIHIGIFCCFCCISLLCIGRVIQL